MSLQLLGKPLGVALLCKTHHYSLALLCFKTWVTGCFGIYGFLAVIYVIFLIYLEIYGQNEATRV